MITDPLTVLLLPVTVIGGLMTIFGLILNASLRRDAKKREQANPRLPLNIKRA